MRGRSDTWTALIAYGIVGQVLGWVLISKGIGKIETSKTGLILLLQPTLSFIWNILFFKRPTGMMVLTGDLLALLAIYLGSTSRRAAHTRAILTLFTGQDINALILNVEREPFHTPFPGLFPL